MYATGIVYLLLIVIINCINMCQVDMVTKAPRCWTRSSGFSTMAGKPPLDTAAVVSLGSLHIKTLCVPNWCALKEPFQVAKTRPNQIKSNQIKFLHMFPLGMFPLNVKQCHFHKTALKVVLAVVWYHGDWIPITTEHMICILYVVQMQRQRAGSAWNLLFRFSPFSDSIVSSIILAHVYAFMTRATLVLSNTK